MLYLFSKILLCLTIAAGLGGAIGWFLRGSARREHLADIESGWRRRLDTAEKERLALAGERDRLIKENASLKSLHSACRPRIEALESEIKAAQRAHDGYDEEITRLKMNLKILQERLATDSTPESESFSAEPEAGEKIGAEQGALSTEEETELDDFELTLPREIDFDDLAASERDLAPDADREPEPAAEKEDFEMAGLLERPEGDRDDLKKIRGIGRVLERTLNELGIFHFGQLARMTDDEVAWVAKNIQTFPDRIARDRWVDQAAKLHEKEYGEKT